MFVLYEHTLAITLNTFYGNSTCDSAWGLNHVIAFKLSKINRSRIVLLIKFKLFCNVMWCASVIEGNGVGTCAAQRFSAGLILYMYCLLLTLPLLLTLTTNMKSAHECSRLGFENKTSYAACLAARPKVVGSIPASDKHSCDEQIPLLISIYILTGFLAAVITTFVKS